jgi:hypothetical protein
VDDVREPNRVAYKEDRDVVADRIPVAVLGAEQPRSSGQVESGVCVDGPYVSVRTEECLRTRVLDFATPHRTRLAPEQSAFVEARWRRAQCAGSGQGPRGLEWESDVALQGAAVYPIVRVMLYAVASPYSAEPSPCPTGWSRRPWLCGRRSVRWCSSGPRGRVCPELGCGQSRRLRCWFT